MRARLHQPSGDEQEPHDPFYFVPSPAKEPPLYTLLMELTGWPLDRTATIPKNARFTFGRRVDNLTLADGW